MGEFVYYKKQEERWRGPGKIVGLDGRCYLVKHGGSVVKVHSHRLKRAPRNKGEKIQFPTEPAVVHLNSIEEENDANDLCSSTSVPDENSRLDVEQLSDSESSCDHEMEPFSASESPYDDAQAATETSDPNRVLIVICQRKETVFVSSLLDQLANLFA